MNVTVGIPTYKNNGTTIVGLLNSLTLQTYRDFKVIIVYKPTPEDKTLDVIERFKKSLDIEILIQKSGLFDEALNMLYSSASDELLITTDDDAIPSSTWIEEHVKLHENFSNIGVIGPVNERSENVLRRNQSNSYLLARLFQTIMERPIDKQMMGFNDYFSRGGLLVRNYYVTDHEKIQKTFNPIGVNMSIKRGVYKGFSLFPMTLRGIGNEPYLCLHAYLNDMPCARVTSHLAKVNHLERDSLSRPRNPLAITERYAEMMLSPYVLSKYYEINLNELRLDALIRTKIWSLKVRSEEDKFALRGIKEGVKLAINAIEKDMPPDWIRHRLKLIQDNNCTEPPD
ncbi:putative glycosyltransferase [Metallosphaera yellowstonensis MK1]|uniref:Putative glycosyltransferase n=1 Tax=Metallosphaera yellowstonensis MK1 TaxID=671065 RepID=H2C0S0_9CREN|nr:glycosyltransferase family A protein [Metallosphaera yellowstonensis]EHP71183.1 putative glycosyltransferase [Metallosphaera yellowstonensis MK1]